MSDRLYDYVLKGTLRGVASLLAHRPLVRRWQE